MLRSRGSSSRRLVAGFCLAAGALAAACQSVSHTLALSPSEQKASQAMERARESALALHAFLERMPKGADLHMHLSGAVYAETFLREAAEDRMCVNPVALTLVRGSEAASCVPPTVPAAGVLANQHLYDALVDSFSMRGFVSTPGRTGHDQFFDTFDRFGGLKNHDADWLDEVATRAAAQNEQYLEVMMTPAFSRAAALGFKLGWPAPAALANSSQPQLTSPQLQVLRSQLLAGGLRDEVAEDAKQIDAALAGREAREHCGRPDAAAACNVTIRVLYQVLRANAPEQVFAQTLLGFEVASADRNVVGINFVQPEDAYRAMTEYHRQMVMLNYLHEAYPSVHISLHAGELAPGMVPPDGLRFHIREAVDLGHAERIGHGVDVMYEQRPEDLLKEMAARHVMVEINLTSNDVILGVKANEHSLPSYRAAGVPVALSTDDEGVSRIDLTHEYARAAVDFHLSYSDLKRMARTSIEHSFLPGKSLWREQDTFTRVDSACTGKGQPGAGYALDGCLTFLEENEKAAQQWELERRFIAFEAACREPLNRAGVN